MAAYVEFSLIEKLHARITEVSPANPGETLNDAVERLIAERDKANELVRALAEETAEWRKQRDAARDELTAAIAERAHYGDMMSAKLGQCENERDALREDNKRLRALLTELTYTPDNSSYNAP
jgi:uncharacterized coiled-coil DUF342 family protein